MNNLFTKNTTLIDAERILEKHFPDSLEDHQITKSVYLSKDDTFHLLNLFDNVGEDRIDEYEKIKLAIIVTWAYAIKYGVRDSDFKKDFLSDINRLPQHHIRYYIELLGSVFEEFDISTYGHNYYDFNGLCAIMDILGNL